MTNEPDKAVRTSVKLSRDLWEEAFTTLDTEYTVYFHESPLVAHLIIAETLVSHIINTNQVDLTRTKPI